MQGPNPPLLQSQLGGIAEEFAALGLGFRRTLQCTPVHLPQSRIREFESPLRGLAEPDYCTAVPHHLIASPEELRRILEPLRAGRVRTVGFDTETTEIPDGRYTTFGTSVRATGFSLSWGRAGDADRVDLYVPVRHVPYDWRREPAALARDTKNDGPSWLRALQDIERVPALPPGQRGPFRSLWVPGTDPNLSPALAFEILAEAMESAGIEWVAHNWPFDAKVLMAEDIALPTEIVDTNIWSVLTDPRPQDAWDEKAGEWVHGGHGLKHLGEAHLGRDPKEKNKLDEARHALGVGNGTLDDWSMLPLRTAVAPYAAQDTRLCVDLLEHMRCRPAYEDSGIQALAEKHHREIRAALDMERRGVHVDVAAAQDALKAKETELAAIHLRAKEAAGGRIVPLTQPGELANFLWTDLAIPAYRDKLDTRKATLKQVRRKVAAGESPIPAECPLSVDQTVRLVDAVLDFRRAYKELTSFYRPLTYFGADGVIYPILNPLRARTTRYSAEKPNIQQIPKPKAGQEAQSVRALIRPEPGWVFLPLDYGGQEMRVATHYANAIPTAFEYLFTWRCSETKRGKGKCKGRGAHGPTVVHTGWRTNTSHRPLRMGLVEGFLAGDLSFDPHQAMVERCAEMGIEGIDRQAGKTANFALLYGAGPQKLAETLDCSYEKAFALFKVFWERAYPELGRVRTYIDERLRNVGQPLFHSGHGQGGFIRTLHGGRIYLQSGYKGLNYIVQRSCREILLNALLACDDYVRAEKLPYRMVFPVHDEIVWTCPATDLDRGVVRQISRLMVEAGAKSTIPMVVEPKLGRENWAELEKLSPEWGFNGVTDAAA